MTAIRKAIQDLRSSCAAQQINLCLGFGPEILPDLTDDIPEDFQSYPGYESCDGSGKLAKGTQEEMMVWINHSDKGTIWKAQYDVRMALDGHMRLQRETPTFIWANSLDMTGFQDGAGNPEPERDTEVAAVAEGKAGAGGCHLIAQRWIHDLKAFHALPLAEQEGVFGRTKEANERMSPQPSHSHLAHVELREGDTGDDSKSKRDEISRRSTPYAFPAPPTGGDGVNGLYFIGFCATQAPLRERMEAMYDVHGKIGIRDRLTDFSTPASGSFYFAPSVEVLDSI